MTDTKPANADQREFWSDIKGELWVELQPRIDPMLAPFGEKAIEALDLMPGERVIEIGCGNGTTTLALAERVGAEGEVLAVDLSRPMLNKAMERGKTSGHPVRFIEADAQVYDFPREYFDAAFSRFGVMFFDDPVAAFNNILGAVRPGGRVAYVCWADRKDNPWIRIPAGASKAYLELPPQPADDEPGQFSMQNEERVRTILSGAGWSDVTLERFDTECSLGSDVADATGFISQMGPMSEPFALADEETQHNTLRVIEEALAPYADSRGAYLGYSTWIVSATRP